MFSTVYFLNKTWVFEQSEGTQVPIYILNLSSLLINKNNCFFHLTDFANVKESQTRHPSKVDLQTNSLNKNNYKTFINNSLILFHFFIFCRFQIIWFGFYAFMPFFIVDLMLLLKF